MTCDDMGDLKWPCQMSSISNFEVLPWILMSYCKALNFKKVTLGHLNGLERLWNMSKLLTLKAISYVRGCLERKIIQWLYNILKNIITKMYLLCVIYIQQEKENVWHLFPAQLPMKALIEP